MKKLFFPILVVIILLSGCKYEVPPEMVTGTWYIEQITENKHDFTSKYVNKYNRYLVFLEDGTFKQGLMDSSREKNWLLYSENNNLMLLNGSPIENVKNWKVRASDEHLELTDKRNHYKILLKRIEKLPKLNLKSQEELTGKWRVEKVTINGYDNTEEYAFPDRWILLSKDGKFYNGGKDQKQNTGFWQLKENLTEIEFFDQEMQNAFISFHIEDDVIWYEKKESEYDKPRVRIYFKKE